jgi:hypothetical protein
MAIGPTESEGKGVRRETNQEINMVPMIDLMVCCVSFLLITAVWSHMARINTSALVPGASELPTAPPDRKLHVDARASGKFILTWKQGATVISTFDLARGEAANGPAGIEERYLDLGAKIAEEWRANGSHRDPSDRRFDQAVLHTGDQLRFGEIVAIIDAIHAPKRQVSGSDVAPAFNVIFAAN